MREATINFDDLTQEEKELVRSKTPEEILALAKERGRELSDEELEALSGGESSGRWMHTVICGKCETAWKVESLEEAWQMCPGCGNRFFA